MNVITVANAVGNVANRVLVKAGHEQGKWHFYCGKKRDSKCLRGVCDPKCGPKDGCNCNACALLDNTVPLPYMDPSSISNEKVNRKGHKAKKVLVTSGHEKDKYHYYCGHKRDTICSYDRCNDICGPSSGCNCHSCAELDRYDGLPPISLAPVASSSNSNSNSNKALCNRNGHPVTLVAVSSGHEAGKQHHYCGKKRDTACPGGGCNNICGPKNGCNCSACKELDYRVFSQPVSLPVVFSHAPTVVQYQAPQVQYTAPPSQLQYQGPPSQYQNQLPPQYYPALPPQPPQQSQPYPPQQYQVPPQYQVPQQYQSYPQPSAPPQGPPSYATQAPPTYTPTPYTPQGPPQGQAISNNNNSTTATSSPKSSTTSTAGAAAATAAAVVSTGFKLLKPVVKATASAATSLVKSAAHHIVDNDKDNSCVICMEKPKNASLVHGQTAHQCCCLECGELLKKSGQSCPICRAPIAAVIRNYSS